MEQGPPRKAFLAARTLAEAVRGPSGILGLRVSDDVRQSWREEHAQTIDRLGRLLAQYPVHPVVLVRAAESVAWHAFHGAEKGNGANRVLSLLERDLETRFVRGLMDGWGNNTWPFDEASGRRAYDNDLAKLIADLGAAFDAPSKLHDFVETWLREVSEIAGADYGAPHIVVGGLIATVPELAQEILKHHHSGRTGALNAYTGTALSVLLRTYAGASREELQRQVAASPEMLRLVAEAYARFEATTGYSEADLPLLQAIFSSKDPVVLHHAGHVALQVARRDKPLAVDLICSVDLVAAGRASHDLFMWLSHGDTIPKEAIGDDQWRRLLANLEPIQELSDHWVREFLKNALRVVPDLVIELLRTRLERAAETDDWSFSPLSKSHGREAGLGLLEIAGGANYLHSLFDWALDHVEDSSTLWRFGNVVAGLCGKYDQEFLDFLVTWISDGTDKHTDIVAAALHEAQNDIIFDYPQFVQEILNCAQAIGPEAVKRLSSSLYAATSSGVRGTTPGEPFPEDLRLEKHALAMLSSLSRWEPAFELYTQLLRTARAGIALQRREKEAMVAEEEE
jgi:hypothetical protein